MSTTVLLAHPGTQHSHQLAQQLVRYSCLSEFWTGFALSTNARYSQLVFSCLPKPWRQRLANRLIKGIPVKHLRTMPWFQVQIMKALKYEGTPERVFYKYNGIFQERIPTASIQKVGAVIGFDTSSWLLAKRSRQMGKFFFLDQSIAHPVIKDQVLRRVAERYPEWREDIQFRSPDVLACEEQEYSLASRIIVASSFTQKTLILQGIPANKITINPYGVDLNQFQPGTSNLSSDRPLRFLFLGAVTARKGIPLLLDAWHLLGLQNCELWLVGPISPQIRALIPNLPGLKVMGQYPHRELSSLLRQCDVLVFPSYFEGFALVLLEALAAGLPIITTEATAGPDLIQDGQEGFIVPAGDQDALCRAMQFFVEHRDKLPEMALAARHCAERYSWDSYGDRWHNLIQEYS